MSCFRFSLSVIVMISLDTADVVVVPALSFTVGPMFERSSKAFKGIPAPVYRIFRVPPLLYSALLSMFFPWQNTGGDPVLFFFCLVVYDCSFEAGVVFDLDIVSFFSCVDACLFCDADIGGVCGVCLLPDGEVGIVHFLFPCIRTGGNISSQMDAAFFVTAVVGMAVLQAFYGEVISCFYFYFLSACFASFNVYIFPAFHGQGVFNIINQ